MYIYIIYIYIYIYIYILVLAFPILSAINASYNINVYGWLNHGYTIILKRKDICIYMI